MPRRHMPAIALAGLLLALLPAHDARAQASGPSFVFPSPAQTFPFAGSYVFQVHPLAGAQGYLWTFQQDGVVVWQNLDAGGTLSPATLTVTAKSAVHARLHAGSLTVRVRALLAKGQWTKSSAVTVQLQASTTKAGVGPCTVWSMPQDFPIKPNQANPAPDQCGNPGVWRFGTATDTLQAFVPDAFGVPGLEQWQLSAADGTNGLPAVGVNATGVLQNVPGTHIVWPAWALRVHPAATQPAILIWRSPIDGTVTFGYTLADMDTSCGTGVEYVPLLEKVGGAAAPIGHQTILKNGETAQGGSTLAVQKGDVLALSIDAADSDPSCDSTDLSFWIAQDTAAQ